MNDNAAPVNNTGIIALLAGASCIALAPIMVKLSPLGPEASAFWRLALSLPFLLVWSILERRNKPDPAALASASTNSFPLIILAGFLFAGDLITWHWGIVRTSAANATFLANLSPIVVVAVTWLLTRVLPSKDYWLAAGVALLGSLLLSGGAPGSDAEQRLGDGLSALTSVWYGLYLLVVAHVRARMGAGTIMLGSSLVGAILCLAFVVATGQNVWPSMATQPWYLVWWPLLVLGLVVHVLGQGLLAVGFGLVRAPVAALLILWQPVLAAILGWLWLEEILSPLQLFGGGLVLLGVWLARRQMQGR